MTGSTALEVCVKVGCLERVVVGLRVNVSVARAVRVALPVAVP